MSNNFLYDKDIAIMAPSYKAFQYLINIDALSARTYFICKEIIVVIFCLNSNDISKT